MGFWGRGNTQQTFEDDFAEWFVHLATGGLHDTAVKEKGEHRAHETLMGNQSGEFLVSLSSSNSQSLTLAVTKLHCESSVSLSALQDGDT